MSVALARLALLAAVGVVWWVVARWLPGYVLPGPERVFDALRLVVITLMATLELAVLRPAEDRLFAWRKAVG